MIQNGARNKGENSSTRLLVEKSNKPLSEEEQDAQDKRTSKLFELLKEHGGAGRAKVYRIGENGEPQYACTWPADNELAEGLEEKLCELGGGRYDVKFFWRSKCEGSVRFWIDPDTHPRKKTDAELRREGGALPQTPAEFQAFITNTVTATLAPFLQNLQQPRPDGTGDLVKLMLLQQNQTAAELREQNARLMESLLSGRGPAASGPRETLREISETAALLDNLRGERGAGSDSKYERRSLATKLIEGPVERAAERVADRLVDKFLDEEDGKPRPAKPGAPRAQARPAAAAVQASSSSSSSSSPSTPAPRPAGLTQVTPTTPVSMPQGVKPLPMGELARMRSGRVPKTTTTTPAPVAAEAVPDAVRVKGT